MLDLRAVCQFGEIGGFLIADLAGLPSPRALSCCICGAKPMAFKLMVGARRAFVCSSQHQCLAETMHRFFNKLKQ